jgi:capsular polysaccharide export protein
MSHAIPPPTASATAPRFAATLVPTPGLAATPHLEAFLPECGRLVRSRAPTAAVDSLAGWGSGPAALRPRQWAAARGWPYLALEDGFLRSVGRGEAGAPPMSLLVDDLGVHHDARQPSRLETLLESEGWEGAALLDRADAMISRMIETGLSRTNASPPLARGVLDRTSRRRVLVIDQGVGDPSIAGGLATTATFAAMLETARREEPGAEIIVRRPPAVAAGRKRGCLGAGALADTTVLDVDCRLADVLERVEAVYTVSSLAGFEALIRGLPVTCFGMPFYAGWGATRDHLVRARRMRRRTPRELFAAAYLLYARYVDPLSGQPCSAETAMDRLLMFRDRADRHAGYTAGLGFTPWKQGSARTLLFSPRGETGFFWRPAAAMAAATRQSGQVVSWAARETASAAARLETSGRPVVRMEDGFLRSRGLGSNFHRAASVVLDDLGIYYDATRPSRLEAILETADVSGETLQRAARLRRALVAAGLSKYNLGAGRAPGAAWPADRFRLLVVGQVENDRSILKGCEDVRTNLGMLRAARAAHPGAFIVFKPHPDVEAGNRRGAVKQSVALATADVIADRTDIDSCIAHTDGVATMTSLAGFEALLRGKPVWTFGRPFYAGWGLTRDALAFPRRTRRLDLDALVAGALITYPIYIHPANGLPCEVEDVVAFLGQSRPEASRDASGLRYWRAFREMFRRRPTVRY